MSKSVTIKSRTRPLAYNTTFTVADYEKKALLIATSVGDEGSPRTWVISVETAAELRDWLMEHIKTETKTVHEVV